MTIDNRFEFSSVSSNFNGHISNSIRGYADLHKMIASLARFFVDSNGKYIDIGSSDGNLAKLVSEKTGCTDITCYEKEKSFYTNSNYDNIEVLSDISTLDTVDVSFITSVFTLQFIQKDKRIDVLKNVYDALQCGGGFIIAEKVILGSELDLALQDILLQDKRGFFTDTEILDKNFMLQNTMKCLSLKDLKSLLRFVGFKDVTIFWQNGLFVALMCRKGLL